MKSFAVIGLGRFGSRLATQLYESGADVLAIDRQAALVEQVSEHVTQAVVADAQNKDVLRDLGVDSCDCAIIGSGSNLAASVLITMNVKSLGVPEIICKAHDETHRQILEKLGADRVIIPEHSVADRLARSLASTGMLDYIELSQDYGVVELGLPKSWRGKSLRELGVRAKYGVNILGVRRGEVITVSPGAEFAFAEGDVLVLLGDYVALERIEKLN